MVTMYDIRDAGNKFREGMMHPQVAAKVKAYIDMIMLHLYKMITNHGRESSSSTLKWASSKGTLFVNVDAG